MYNCERLREIREDNKLTQTDIAHLLKTTRQQYVILAEYYNISVDYLLGLIDTPRKLH